MYPVLFKLGPFTVPSYGVMLATAFVVGLYLARREARRKGLGEESIVNFFPYILIAGLIGARLYYIAFYDLGGYLTHPAEIFSIWKGGLAFHGGVIGGLLITVWFTKKRNISFWKFGDTLTPSLIFGETLGRIGCFLNGCCYGVPTQLPWGVTFPEGSGSQPLHPTQLYQAFLNFSIFLFLWNWRKKARFDGSLFLLYLILYSAGRFLIETLRGDSLYVWGTSLKAAQVMGILIIVVSLLIMRWGRRKSAALEGND